MVGKLGDLLTLLASPVGTAGLVAVLALFMLLEREELRDRLIWLTGARDLTSHDARARRRREAREPLSRHAIADLRHPGAAVRRGSWRSACRARCCGGRSRRSCASCPTSARGSPRAADPALARGVPGLDQPRLTVALFVSLELFSNNVLEPWLYGASAGLSPFGVIFSAVFWTWLWGIPGLLLATPLTVCLVVAGRYVRRSSSSRCCSAIGRPCGRDPPLPTSARARSRRGAAVLRRRPPTASLDGSPTAWCCPRCAALPSDDQRDAGPGPCESGVARAARGDARRSARKVATRATPR